MTDKKFRTFTVTSEFARTAVCTVVLDETHLKGITTIKSDEDLLRATNALMRGAYYAGKRDGVARTKTPTNTLMGSINDHEIPKILADTIPPHMRIIWILATTPEKELLELPGFGKACLRHLKEFLVSLGLTTEMNLGEYLEEFVRNHNEG